MNTRILVATLSLAAAGSAFASEVSDIAWPQGVSQLTRAEVTAQAAQERAAGQLSVGEAEVLRAPVAMSAKSREDVRADLANARAVGELQRLSAEAYDFAGDKPAAVAARIANAPASPILR
jgi:hypothetical protein